jgi:putative PEP-CTERM system TPR-repeat lipoprotein
VARTMQKQAPKSPFGFVMEADILSVQKKFDAAARAYDTSFNLSKNSAMLVKVHDALTKAGKGKEADARTAAWLRDHPEDLQVRSYLATAALMKRDTKNAVTQFEALLKTHPEDASILNNLALAYQQEKNPRAVETAEKALKLAPESAAVLDTLGWMLVENGDTARGLPYLQKAAGLAPGSFDIRYHLAQSLVKAGDKPGARKELEKMMADGAGNPRLAEVKALLATL